MLLSFNVTFNIACQLSQPMGKKEFSSTTKNSTNFVSQVRKSRLDICVLIHPKASKVVCLPVNKMQQSAVKWRSDNRNSGWICARFWPGLGLPSQRPKLYQKSTLAKIFTKRTSKSAKHRLPLRYKKAQLE